MMRTRIRHIIARVIPTLAVCIACLVFHGCNSEIENPGVITDDGIVQVGFRIRLGEDYGTHLPESRADVTMPPSDYDDSEKYETGTGYENYIGITGNDFRFMLFDGDGKFVETMNVLYVVPVGEEKYPSDYTVLCTLTKKPDETFRIVALANWGSYPQATNLTVGVTTIRDVCENARANNTYAYTAPFTPSAKTPIPMYGVKTCSMPANTDRYIDIGNLYLLRAMAKVEVVCSETPYLELQSVQLTGYNTNGYCAPQGMYDNTGYVSAPHIPTDAGSNVTAPLAFHVSADKSKAWIYIPEYLNTGAGTPCQLSVTFVDNPDKHYPADFCEYDSDGKPTGNRLDILRSVCYRFTVDKTAEFTVDLLPYGVEDLNPDFGI